MCEFAERTSTPARTGTTAGYSAIAEEDQWQAMEQVSLILQLF